MIHDVMAAEVMLEIPQFSWHEGLEERLYVGHSCNQGGGLGILEAGKIKEWSPKFCV